MINTNAKLCTNFKSRLFGLSFRKELEPLCFPNCRGVHTFFMKKNIDIIMTDNNHKVIKIYKNVGKNKIIYNIKSKYVYELPVDKYKIKLNDTII